LKPLPKEKQTSIKPYYSDGSVSIYHGDAYEIVQKLKTPDLLLTDPPYKIASVGGGIASKRKYFDGIAGKIDGGFNMAILEQFDNWCVFCGKQQLIELLGAVGERMWALVTWGKPNPTPLTNSNYLPDVEYIVHAYKPGRLFGEYRDKSRYIIHPIEKNTYSHPTVKPIAVVAKMIRLGTGVGDLICDPFLGTGTTLVAAKMMGRLGIGIEIEERFCEVAAQRLSQGVLQL